MKNVLGFKGKIAKAFGRLASDLYSGGDSTSSSSNNSSNNSSSNNSSVSPSSFFRDLCSERDQFAGNDQHDAHELLSFLLDGLSEDLNLVTGAKPYSELPDSDSGVSEVELADLWWESHLQRDRSVIQALFTGQFKSVMGCGLCGFRSARYEPFNALTVPIPEENLYRSVTITVIPITTRLSRLVKLKTLRSGSLRDLAVCLVESHPTLFTGGQPTEEVHLIAGDLVDSQVKSFNSMNRKLDSYFPGKESLVMFQVGRRPTTVVATASIHFSHGSSGGVTTMSSSSKEVEVEVEEVSGKVRVAFTQRRLVRTSVSSISGFDYLEMQSFGIPVLEVMDETSVGAEMYAVVHSRLKDFVASRTSSNSVAACSNTTSTSMIHEEGNDVGCVTDQVMGSYPPPIFGFTLRLVTGGNSQNSNCSRCPWLSRCQGCVVADDKEVLVGLRDGETIAVDWHCSLRILPQELLLVTDHHSEVVQSTVVSLYKCLVSSYYSYYDIICLLLPNAGQVHGRREVR